MRGLLKTLGNAALVVGGFLAVFFGVSRTTNENNQPQLSLSNDPWETADAMAPYSQGYYQGGYYGQGGYGDSGSCGGDCGDCGCDGGK